MMLSSVVLVLLMFGVILTIDGFYHDEITFLKNNPKIVYQTVPSGIVDVEFSSSRTSPADFTTLDATLHSVSPTVTKTFNPTFHPVELNVVESNVTSETDKLSTSTRPSSR